MPSSPITSSPSQPRRVDSDPTLEHRQERDANRGMPDVPELVRRRSASPPPKRRRSAPSSVSTGPGSPAEVPSLRGSSNLARRSAQTAAARDGQIYPDLTAGIRRTDPEDPALLAAINERTKRDLLVDGHLSEPAVQAVRPSTDEGILDVLRELPFAFEMPSRPLEAAPSLAGASERDKGKAPARQLPTDESSATRGVSSAGTQPNVEPGVPDVLHRLNASISTIFSQETVDQMRRAMQVFVDDLASFQGSNLDGLKHEKHEEVDALSFTHKTLKALTENALRARLSMADLQFVFSGLLVSRFQRVGSSGMTARHTMIEEIADSLHEMSDTPTPPDTDKAEEALSKRERGQRGLLALQAACVTGIDFGGTSLDNYVLTFLVMAALQRSEVRLAAYKSLGRGYPDGCMAIDRRVMRALHPDTPGNAARMNEDGFKERLDLRRCAYETGRDEFRRACRVPEHHMMVLVINGAPRVTLDAQHAAGMRTKLEYDPSTQYQPSMGDIFYHPLRDRFYRQQARTLPGDLEKPIQETKTVDEHGDEIVREVVIPAGFIQAHFLEFDVEHVAARERFIRLCLGATQEELLELDPVRECAEAVIVNDPNGVNDMISLITACQFMHKHDYLRSFGMWSEIIDPKVKARVDDFIANASIADVYQLVPRERNVPNFILEACLQHGNLPVEQVIERAKEAQLTHDGGNAVETPPEPDDELDLLGDVETQLPSTSEDLFGGMGGWA